MAYATSARSKRSPFFGIVVRMATCAWCMAKMADARAPCPSCGRSSDDLIAGDGPALEPSSPAMVVPDLVIPQPRASRPALAAPTPAVPPPAPSGPSAFDDEDLGGGADLQLDLSGAVAAPPKPAVTSPATGGGFSPFDDDEMMGSGVSLDLDMSGGGLPPRISGASLPPAVSSGSLPPSPVSQRSLPPVSQRSLPPAADASPGTAPGVDPFEARALADFGPPPDVFWRAPMYALRVVRRRAELRRALALRKDESADAARRAEDALVAFAERARPIAESAGGRGLDDVRAAEDLMRGRDSALAAEMDAHKGALAEVDARLAPVEAELAAAKQEEEKIARELAAAEEVRRRAEAKVKRAEIEIRNATQLLASRRAPQGAPQ